MTNTATTNGGAAKTASIWARTTSGSAFESVVDGRLALDAAKSLSDAGHDVFAIDVYGADATGWESEETVRVWEAA
ncbi:MAG: hypothetical protein HOW73_20285 [Polyangiaceae bacterium]|nr:hypothetical protein [Polyangiaceae bacterium]